MKLWARLLTTFLALAVAGLGLPVPALGDPSPRIVAVGDVHGSPGAFSRLLRAAGLVDDAGAWVGGDAILVQTGDLTDRGPGVREVLDLMRDLEKSAAAGGGRVVSLLGNHEIYNLIGYYDYQSTPLPVFSAIASSFADSGSEKARKKAYKGWASWAKKYSSCVDASKDAWMARNPLGFIEYQEALSQRGEYGRWLRQKKVVANVADTLFLHGGLSPELAATELRSVDAINARAAAELEQFDRDREWLDRNGVVSRYPTLAELHCAVAYELQRLGRQFAPEVEVRRQRLEEIQGRLPGQATWMLLNPSGPVWFRGYASWSDEEAEAELASVLETFGGKRVVVGHTPQIGEISSRFQARVFLIDTAMAYPELEGRPVALEIRGDVISMISEAGRVAFDQETPKTGPPSSTEEPAVPATDASADAIPAGERNQTGHATSETRGQWSGTEPGAQDLVDGLAGGHEPLASSAPGQAAQSPAVRDADADTGADAGLLARGLASSQQGWLGPDGEPLPFADEASVLEFLETATIVEKETMGKGVSRAKKLLLEKDGVRAYAVFHDIHDETMRYKDKDRLFMNFRDSYINNLAAYELGRLLGITNLAPTAPRKVGRANGSIQLWIEETIDETKRRELVEKDDLSVYLRRRISDMWVFDNLINNIDRNQGNMLHDSRGEFWMIDHTRSFNGSDRLPDPQRIKRCSRELLTAIRNLDKELVQERLVPQRSKGQAGSKKRSPLLRSFELNSFWARRQRLLEFLDERIAAKGEDQVLFTYEDLADQVTVYYEEDDIPAPPRER